MWQCVLYSSASVLKYSKGCVLHILNIVFYIQNHQITLSCSKVKFKYTMKKNTKNQQPNGAWDRLRHISDVKN